MAQKVGYTYGRGTEGAEEILASTVGVIFKSVTLSSETRDVGHSPNTDLRKGLALGKGDATDTGKWTDFDSGHSDIDVVILAENIFDINKGDQIISVISAGKLKSGAIKEDGHTVVKADMNRGISIDNTE